MVGTNYYTPSGVHIGKTSAAGLWCPDCKVPLAIAAIDSQGAFLHGWDAVHQPKDIARRNHCPVCGLIADKCKPAMSFTWAMSLIDFDHLRASHLGTPTLAVIDSYGNWFTLDDFISKVIQRSTLQIWNMVDRDFD